MSSAWNSLFVYMLVHVSRVFVKCNEYPCVYIYSSSAVDTKMHVKVAIKKLARPFQSAVHAKRTYRELRMLKHMNHENVSHALIGCRLIYLHSVSYLIYSNIEQEFFYSNLSSEKMGVALLVVHKVVCVLCIYITENKD